MARRRITAGGESSRLRWELNDDGDKGVLVEIWRKENERGEGDHVSLHFPDWDQAFAALPKILDLMTKPQERQA